MERTSRFLCGLLVLCVTVAPAFAARSDVGTSGAVFLKMNTGARPAAMGEAFTGLGGDANAFFYNPAGTAGIEKMEFMAQYGSWFQDIGYNAMSFVYPAKKWGTLGIGVINLSVTDIERRATDTSAPDGTFGASDYAYILHYSRPVTGTVDAGANVKIINQKIDDKTAGAVAGDAGVFWKTPYEGLTAGLAVQNFGGEIKFVNDGSPLPLTTRAGAGYIFPAGGGANIALAADVVFPRDNDTQFCAGAEYTRVLPKDFSVAMRGGYKTVSQEKLGGLSGLTAGAGLHWKQFGLDFAWVPYGDLGDTFRYSLKMVF